jgi:signal transduction histidine kinase
VEAGGSRDVDGVFADVKTGIEHGVMMRKFDRAFNSIARCITYLLGIALLLYALKKGQPYIQDFLNFPIYDTPLKGTVTVFILIFTLFVMITIYVSWHYGGYKAFVISTIAWNLEILLYNFYSGKWEYVVEHINIILFLYLLNKESPADKKTREKYELENQKKHLEKYKLMFEKMYEEVEAKTSAQIHYLQELEFDWKEMLIKSFRSLRHDLRNKLEESYQNELEKHVYDNVIKPFEEKIISTLDELPEIYDMSLKSVDVKEVHESIYKRLPNNIKESRVYDFVYNPLPMELTNGNYHINVNLIKLYSILFNLISNSSRAISRLKDEMREQGKQVHGVIEVIFNLTRYGNEFLEVVVKDNGGGFPKEIIDKVYSEPVVSSDSSRGKRQGEGTAYVAFFVEYMEGSVKAENYEREDAKVAVTIIELPIQRNQL